MERHIVRIIQPENVLEGAGVHLQRTIASHALNYLDPFLLLDHFDSRNRKDYEAGFPMHPHRGIETVTYILGGEVHHQDTLGNSGSIGAGDAQWMTSGRGILHEEMPQVRPEGVRGFQLWVNLPAKNKMGKPRYQDIRAASIPEIEDSNGAKIRIITGTVGDIQGPVTGIEADPIYMDVAVPPNAMFTIPVKAGHNAFAYLFDGRATFTSDAQGSQSEITSPKLVIFSEGDEIKIRASSQGARFLLVSGKPLNEPVARYGPFVMNTKEEIQQTLEELRRGTFLG